MRGRKWLIALGILLACVVGFWLGWRSPSSSLKKEAQHLKPELSVGTVNITNISEDKINATATVVLRNNLPIEVKTNRLDYTIYIDSAKIVEDSYRKPLKIRSLDTTAITLPMEIMLRKMVAVLKRFDDKKVDSADYTMKATFMVDVPIAGERNFTMNLSKRMPALRIPKIKMEDFDISKFGLKETNIDMVMNVENPNAFPIKLKDGKYKLTIDNDENVMYGAMEKIINIPAHGTEPVTMQVDMKTMKVPKLGWKMLFDKKGTTFDMNFSCKLQSDNKMFNNSNMAMKMKGTLDDLKDAVKKK